MSLDARIEALQEKHHALESQIEQEHARPHPDDALIAGLKKQKLKIKDELSELHPS